MFFNVIICQKWIIKLHIKTSCSETLPDSYNERSDNQLHHQDQNTKEYIPASSWLQKMSTREYKKNPVMAYPRRHLWTIQETNTRGDQRLPHTSKGCEKSKFCHTLENINIKDVKESRSIVRGQRPYRVPPWISHLPSCCILCRHEKNQRKERMIWDSWYFDPIHIPNSWEELSLSPKQLLPSLWV